MYIDLSIITPVYNGVRFIECCIENVVQQNCPYMEHIIIDGGSTDGTIGVIKRYAERFDHIRWVSEKDRGQSDAMNKGIDKARGKIIGFLNVDDYYERNVLNRVIKMFDTLPDPSILVGNCNVWDNNGKLWFVSKPAKISFENLLSGRFMEAFPMNAAAYFYHAALHKKIGLYNTDEHYAMDVEFMLEAVQVANVRYIDELFGNYRYLEGTKTFINDKSGATQKIVRDIVYVYLKGLPFYKRMMFMVRYELPRSKTWQRIKALCI